MPFPIRPNGFAEERSEGAPSLGYLTISPEYLQEQISTVSLTSLISEASVTDTEAAMVFSLWQNCSLKKDSDEIQDRIYEVPTSFASQDILRMKTKGLVVRKENGVSFTAKAADVIKDMVLAEQNSFHKTAGQLPYHVIAAEKKIAKRSNNLALTSGEGSLWSMTLQNKEGEEYDIGVVGKPGAYTAITTRASGSSTLKTSASLKPVLDKAKDYAIQSISNGSVLKSNSVRTLEKHAMPASPNAKINKCKEQPKSDSKFIYNRRVMNTSGGHFKEYNVRVYELAEGLGWDVWGFNGKINGSMTQQDKGHFDSTVDALYAADRIIGTKIGGDYNDATIAGFPEVNSSLPGTQKSTNGIPSSAPNKKVFPKPATPPPVTEDSVLSLVDALFGEDEDEGFNY